MNRAAVATAPLSPPGSDAGERARRILHAPVLPTLLKLALPNLVVMLAQALANFLESYYVGLIGVDALAGAALVFPLVMLMMMMSGGGIGGGISSAVARALGSGDADKANALALHAVVITGVLGLLCSLVVIGSGPALYALLGGRDQALDAALAYSNALFAGVTFLWLMNGLSAVLRGAGNMLMPALVLTGGVLLLLVLSPLLIFGIGPLPGMGITGAGLALAAYYLIATVILAVALLRGHGGVRLDLRAPLSKTLFAEILGVGLWSALNTVFSNLCVVVATFFVARTGMTALAGFGLGIRIEYLQIPLSFGFGTALVAMVGMNMGAGQIQRARRVAWIGAALTAATTGTVGLLAATFPMAWLGLFTDDAEAIATGAVYLRTVAPVYGFFGVGGALMTTLFPGDLVALCTVMAASLVALAAVNSIPWLIRR